MACDLGDRESSRALQTRGTRNAGARVVGKLDQLRDITSKTQQPPGHQAWRPNGNPEDAMAALDLQVAERELEELRVVGQALNSEMEQMEEKLNAAKKREEL